MTAFPTDLPKHLIKALQDGKSIFWGDRVVTLKDFGDPAKLGGEAFELQMELQRAQERATRVQAENTALREEIAGLQAKPKGEDHSELIESLIPDSKTGLERLPVDALQAVAKYRGLPTEGKDKAALVADLLPKGGN